MDNRLSFRSRNIELENNALLSRSHISDFFVFYLLIRYCMAFLNTEPGNKNGHIILRKGICKFRFEVVGRAAHSSRCYSGVSAISEAAQKIIRLEHYKDEDGITCNCGLINGGSAENTVPERCTFTADFRFHTEEQRNEIMSFTEEIASTSFVKGTECKLSLVSSRCAMQKTKYNIELFEKVRNIYIANCLGDIEMLESLGGADSADLTQMGIACLDGFGIIGDGIHKLSEFAYLTSLAFAAKRLASVAYCIE